ncbi:LysR substrate binding domain protein [Vibrio thalassae]|uniref:LysR substrate binding domain protein n=1 Tax=Vibrio thalassae TaxID=1243014 RepID=A0A240ELZ3_9VIBR|nr:LysR substrate binding domain protein [Vibrio thalassae]
MKYGEVTLTELANVTQIVIRDLGDSTLGKRKQDVGWLKGQQRITVDNFDHAFKAVESGVGFCRLPRHVIESRNHGQLVVLNVTLSDLYQVPLHLTLPKGVQTGPAALAMYTELKSLRQT